MAELEQVAPRQPAASQVEGVQRDSDSDWRRKALESIALRKVLAPQAPPSDTRLQERIEELRKKILATTLTHELGWDSVTATDEEARAHYLSHRDEYRDPEKIHFQHIFFRAEAEEMSPAERALVRKRLENLRKEILAGADFDAMAREYSQSADSQSGGWSGLKRGEKKVFAAFTDVAWSLRNDEVSGVVDTPTGFHLIKLKEKTQLQDRTFEEVKEFARMKAAAAKLEETRQAFLEDAGKRFGLARHYERLEDPLVPDDAALLVVGSSKLTMRQLLERIPPNLIEHLFNAWFPAVHRFLDNVAVEELLVREAETRRLEERPDVALSIRVAADEVRAEAALEARLKRKVAALPEKELRDFFTQNEKRYHTWRTLDLDVILLKPMPRENPWRVLKRAEALVERIVAGEGFASLARAHSRHYSARDGGRMAGLTDQDIAHRVQSTAKFRRMLQGLEEGEVGNAMVAECYDTERLRFENTGAIIVRLVRVHPPVPQPFEKVRDVVEERYRRRNSQRLDAEMKKEILDSAGFRVYPERLPPV
jgi:parvulin-like peptidyl-prolyl isomerase